MIHMDVDMHSPRRQRIASVKRARSPEPSSPQDRPSKRLSLNVVHPNPYPSNFRKRFDDHSSGSSRHSSEDWVQQTGGLSIDSPILLGSLFQSEHEEAEGVHKDNDMMMETSDSQETVTLSEKPQLSLLQTSNYPSPFTSNQTSQSNNAHQQIPTSSITTAQSGCGPFQETPPLLAPPESYQRSLLGPSPLMGPSINVEPPTPMERQLSQGYQRTNSPLALDSNTSSPVSAAPPSPKSMTSRKQPRFMMGPRADCEKCRLGVKGHFVHLD